jgi:hypothetical protein
VVTWDCIGGSTDTPSIVPIQKRRSRIVSFRLSDEEYDSLKSVTASRGARSVSEFTRSVACNMSTDGNGAEKIEDSLRTLNDRMQALDRRLQMLTEVLEEKNGANHTNSHEMETKEPLE